MSKSRSYTTVKEFLDSRELQADSVYNSASIRIREKESGDIILVISGEELMEAKNVKGTIELLQRRLSYKGYE